jgi:hypothetical protein
MGTVSLALTGMQHIVNNTFGCNECFVVDGLLRVQEIIFQLPTSDNAEKNENVELLFTVFI